MKILFRGKKIGSNEFVYGDLIHFQRLNKGVWIDMVGISTIEYEYDIDPETVGQFTGVYDKSGTPVFVGDKVKCCDGIEKDGSAACWVDTVESIFDIVDVGLFIVKVVGNIHGVELK